MCSVALRQVWLVPISFVELHLGKAGSVRSVELRSVSFRYCALRQMWCVP